MNYTTFKKNVTWLIFGLVLSLMYWFIFFKTVKFNDTAYLGGDTWEYQSIAVNFAKGHGFPVFGQIEPFEVYKFDPSNPELKTEFLKVDNNYFFRSPLYPLTLGFVYKIVGISPIKFKYIQLFLLCLIAGFLPHLGYLHWKEKGFLAGLIAGAIYISSNYLFALYILQEAFSAFMIFLIVVAFSLYEKYKKISYILLSGILCAVAFLLKGNVLFLPIIIVVYFVSKYFYTKKIQLIYHSIFYVLTFISVVGIYSVYAYNKTEQIIMTSQHNNLLMTWNNELCVDGNWHPEYKTVTTFYNTDGLSNKSEIIRILNFYIHEPILFIRIMSAKIIRNMYPHVALWFCGLLYILLHLSQFIRTKNNQILRILFGLLSCVASLFFISGVFYPIEFHSFYSNTVHNAVFFFSVVCIFFICIFFDKRLEIRFEIPKTFIAIFINFILICFLAHYDGHIYRSRFVKVMDFVFILTAVYKTIQTIENIYINKLKKEYHDKRITTT